MHTLRPLPPVRSRVLPWLLFALLWSLGTGLIVVGSQVAAAFAG